MSSSEVLFSCTIAAGLFGSMLYLNFHPGKNEVLNDFLNTLNEGQKILYMKIKKERANIYFQSLIISLLLGFLYLNNSKKSGIRTCIFTSIVLGLNIIFYILWPKSTYMIKHLENESQKNAWLSVYKFMQFNHYFGMVLGGAAYIIVASYL